ncbi:transposable element Tcb2 transposase [Trichonephila clavipes]|nr:transposable element Tcb2 transposase [Trichonephila clavipes]
MSTISQRSHLTDSEAWRVVGRLEGGKTQAEVAQAIGVSQKGISRIWKRFLKTGSAGRTPGQGVFSSGGTVAIGIILRVCTKVSDLTVGGVLVYGGISIDGRADLYIIRDGPLTARIYREEILRPIVVPYAVAIGDDFILMDDNCRLYRANLVEDFLFEEGIVRMEWPACSPDMNPIEHVWDAIGRRVTSHQPPPQSSSGGVGQNTPTRD